MATDNTGSHNHPTSILAPMPDSLAGAKRLTAAKRAVPSQGGPAFCKPCAAQYIEGRHKTMPDKKQQTPAAANYLQELATVFVVQPSRGLLSLFGEALKHKSQLRNTADLNETPTNQTILKEKKKTKSNQT